MHRFSKYILATLVVLAISSCKMMPQGKKVEEVYQNTTTGDMIKLAQDLKPTKERTPGDVRVSLLLPLSGENALLGRHLLDATQLAIYELKAENIHLMPIDTALGSNFVQAKLENEEPDLILGPLYAADAKAVYDYASGNKVCMITFSNDRDLAGKDCLFLLGMMPEESVKRITKFAQSKALPDIHGILPKSKYGNTIEASLAHLNNRANSQVKIIGRYDPSNIKEDAKQVTANISHYAEANTTLIIPEGGETLKEVLTNMRGLKGGKKVKYLGSGLWEDEKIQSIPELNGSWFASPPRADRIAFDKRFEDSFHYKPSRLSSLAYDGIALVAALSQNGLNKETLDKKAILNPAGFRGLTGIFRFKEDGTNQRAMSVYEVRRDGFLEIDPAPQNFIGAVYD